MRQSDASEGWEASKDETLVATCGSELTRQPTRPPSQAKNNGGTAEIIRTRKPILSMA